MPRCYGRLKLVSVKWSGFLVNAMHYLLAAFYRSGNGSDRKRTTLKQAVRSCPKGCASGQPATGSACSASSRIFVSPGNLKPICLCFGTCLKFTWEFSSDPHFRTAFAPVIGVTTPVRRESAGNRIYFETLRGFLRIHHW